jgi:calcium-binding protein CML
MSSSDAPTDKHKRLISLAELQRTDSHEKSDSTKLREPKVGSRLAGLTAEFLEEIRGIFDLFDISKSGRLKSSDISRAMRELGEDLEIEEVEDMMELADLDHDGYIGFEDFVSVIMR